MKQLLIRIKHILAMFRYFQSPSLTLLVRLGIFRMAYCSYDVQKNGRSYRLLGRPLGGDHRILREVLIDESYGSVLPKLGGKPLRILEIGAHIGTFMMWLIDHKTMGEAYCFEPNSESFNLCRFNLASRQNVQVARIALGGKTRQSSIWIDPAAHARSTIVEGMGRPENTFVESTKVVSLAEWLLDHPGSWDMLKMDCEGAEWEILDECAEVLSRFSLIVAEIHHDPVKHRTKADFASVIEHLGFKIVSNDRLFLAVKNTQ